MTDRSAAIPTLTARTALRLGRVSNLPTVWTNVLAALALSGAPLVAPATPLLLVALSLFYVGGMYLNDAFDSRIDALQGKERPIPAGEVTRGTVFVLGFGALGLGLVLLAWAAAWSGGTPGMAALAGLTLAGAILLYDVWHKGNPVSPVLMGLTRMLVYAAVAVAAVGQLAAEALAVGALLLCYVIGLTYTAKQEHLGRVGNLWPLAFLAAPFLAALTFLPETGALAWAVAAGFLGWTVFAVSLLLRDPPPVGRAVVSLIAGIALFDALWLAIVGFPVGALVAVAAFGLTLALQRHVPGT